MLTMNTTNEVFNIYKLRMLLCLCSNIRRRNLYDDKVGTVLSQLSFLSIFFCIFLKAFLYYDIYLLE